MWAITNGKIYTVSDGIVENGSILIADDGRIIDVGDDLDLSKIDTIYNVHGSVVTPGFIDVHTHLGIEEEIHPEGEDTNEMTNPITPELRALDGVNFFDIGFKDAAKGGITTVMITMGSANVIGGVTCTVKTQGNSVAHRTLAKISGLKMAFGENPKRVYGENKKKPETRMAIMALARQAFEDALQYRKDRDEGKVGIDFGKEHLLLALDRNIPVRLHAHRADDILQAIRLRDEFDLDMVIEHCTDAARIKDELAASGVNCAVGPAFVNRAKVEMENVSYHVGEQLAQKNIPFAIITDHPVNPIQYLPICAGLYIKAGLSPEKALEAVTINAAKILRQDQRIGSLSPGKDADIVVWSGEPFTLMAEPSMVFIDGKRYV